MRYASVCSGVEAASLAWMPLGWEAVWFSEIEPFPCAVLKERFPDVPNLGDMTEIKGEKYHGTVDLLVGGTPCQSFSVAGKQAGLRGVSGLALTYCELLASMRPHWFVWENVPGVFSTNGGEDFKTLLRTFDEIGYSVAWRVLDAQYVRVDGFPRAVPQRRRRVFVVGHLGGDWRYPASVLFEPGCLPGDTPPRRVKGKGFTGNFTSGAGETGRLWDASGVNPTLNQCNAGSGIIGASNQELFSQNANGIVISIAGGQAGELGCIGEEVSQTLSRNNGDLLPTISSAHHHAVAITENIIGRKENNGGNGTGAQVELAYPQNATGVMGACNTTQGENQNADAEKARAVKILRLLRDEIGEKAFCEWTLGRLGSFQAEKVLQPNLHGESVRREAGEEKNRLDDSALSCAKNNAKNDLRCLWEQFQLGHPSQGQELAQQFTAELNLRLSQLPHEIASVATVRRLLPIETERLMGFPDNHTRIPWRGKPEEKCPDSPRYKACGNSMCVNVMRWIGLRIENVERRMKGIDNE